MAFSKSCLPLNTLKRRMLMKKKARKGEWAKHLRPFGKKTANKKHRKMNKAMAKEG